MPALAPPRVFDPFCTTKGSQGTKLGLSQVYGFAHQSGGTVVIDSTLGAGTRITLLSALPVPLVTGYSDTAASAEAEFTVWRKPYRLVDLHRAVAKVVAGAREPAPANLVYLGAVRRRLPPRR